MKNFKSFLMPLINSLKRKAIQESPWGIKRKQNNKTGAQVVLNKPGVSRIDILQGLGIAAAFTPAGRLTGAVKVGDRR